MTSLDLPFTKGVKQIKPYRISYSHLNLQQRHRRETFVYSLPNLTHIFTLRVLSARRACIDRAIESTVMLRYHWRKLMEILTDYDIKPTERMLDILAVMTASLQRCFKAVAICTSRLMPLNASEDSACRANEPESSSCQGVCAWPTLWVGETSTGPTTLYSCMTATSKLWQGRR